MFEQEPLIIICYHFLILLIDKMRVLNGQWLNSKFGIYQIVQLQYQK